MISGNLAWRLLIAAIFIPLLLLVFHYGGIPFLVFVELLIAISLLEFFSLLNLKLYFWQKLLLLIAALSPPLAIRFLGGDYLVEFILVVLFLTALPHVFSRELGKIGRTIGLSFFGVLYLAISYNCLILIRETAIVPADLAAGWITFLFATIWIADTAAYFVGFKLGKRKLAPTVSPNKTVAGFVGGFVGALLSAGIFHFIFLAQVGVGRLIVPSLLIALFGQLGDLVESVFKREAGRKDSSNLIPGHGGVLDRFDSLLFAAPALYLYLRFIH
ncbi:MAG: phosphatidate cytidylyltransferase [candidate division Zixibacteria bacterium]|nr:phosphatidate cytidylyltransferase [candidate division Zixibacteria bacterium]